METPGVVPVALARLSVSVPSVLPVVTGTFQVRPPLLVVGVPTLAPVAAAPLREKLLALTPVLAAAKVSVQFTVERFVVAGLTRFREVTVVLLLTTALLPNVVPRVLAGGADPFVPDQLVAVMTRESQPARFVAEVGPVYWTFKEMTTSDKDRPFVPASPSLWGAVPMLIPF